MTGKPLQLGLAGLGTVGTGVFETLCRNHDLLETRVQMAFNVRKIAVRDLNRPREVKVALCRKARGGARYEPRP